MQVSSPFPFQNSVSYRSWFVRSVSFYSLGRPLGDGPSFKNVGVVVLISSCPDNIVVHVRLLVGSRICIEVSRIVYYCIVVAVPV